MSLARRTLRYVLPCLIPLLASCADKVLLTNHTVFGIDVTNTNGANAVVGFKRSELAHVPKRDNGGAHSTFMKLDNKYDFGKEYCVNQQIATGAAADAAATAVATNKVLSETEVNNLSRDAETMKVNAFNYKERDPLVFHTYTSWGITDLNLSLSNPQNSFSLLHFKRSEGAVIQVDPENEVRDIYGSFYLNDSDDAEKATAHVQIMATGSAATRYAADPGRWTSQLCNPVPAPAAPNTVADNG